jgi:transketolase
VLAHVLERGGGYLSQACSSAEIFAVLYGRVLRLKKLPHPLSAGCFEGTPKPGRPAVTGATFNGGGDPDCDNFILSPAQYALVLYAALVETGRMDEKSMEAYDKDGSTVEVIGAEHSPGMEVTTGSLGQGISQASGIAMARKIRGETGRVVLLMSDGECQSGEFWEAVQAACFHKLGNMLVYVDVNGFQCDGKMTSVMGLEPFDRRLRAFGARVSRIDGHDVKKLARPGQRRYKASDDPNVPVFVLCDTDPCRGMDILKKRYPKFHYVRFSSADEKAAYRKFYDSFMSSMGTGLIFGGV